ncbi:VWA domain-containing protein [Desulfosporosinus sp. Sb-LF]|uniref:VWA domain-containing protein n=1 Tax=Desulfosporosinus sp. Sb-LF TaxID=2560027 RepID=UPI00107F5F6A|nr:VWA domain-containing protein [Desulfosporosinus sp. Sb-LF]TGE31619.1 VWA domain-containing protein [Desulfosporosinus sp. Sb-LF]
MNGWKFIQLVYALRELSISISSQDIVNALTCLLRFPDLSEKLITKTTFICRPQDASIFEMIWEILFMNQMPRENATNCSFSEENRGTLGVGGQGVGRGTGGVSLTSKGEIVESAHVPNLIPFSRLEELVCHGTDYEGVVQSVLAEIDYYTWINAYDLADQRGALSEEEWYDHQSSRVSLVREIRQRVLTVQVSQENSWEPLVRQHWFLKSLNTLTEGEKDLVKSSIRKWARKLAIRQGFRWKNNHKGTIDISRIVQQSAQSNGLLFRLSYRQKIRRAPELVILCDVSNSMASYVEFLIYLVTCLRVRFRKIRVFFFIDSVWDVTEFVWEDELSGIKQEIKSWGHKMSSGFSDYGAVFRELAENRLMDVSSRATLVILGDGKNNYRPAQTEYIAQISEKVRHIFWLNPLDVQEWNEADNLMKAYQVYCTKVYRCRSASDLQRVVMNVF